MKSNKKGAIEMSMTTIIVIIIGVVLLSLGLAFVQQIFSKAKKISIETFERAEGQIKDFNQIKSELTITSDNLEIEKGSARVISVILANLGSAAASASATVSVPSQFQNDISCVFVDSEKSKSDIYAIKSGEFRSLDLRIESKDSGVLGSKSCKVVASGLGESIQDTISIRVVA